MSAVLKERTDRVVDLLGRAPLPFPIPNSNLPRSLYTDLRIDRGLSSQTHTQFRVTRSQGLLTFVVANALSLPKLGMRTDTFLFILHSLPVSFRIFV